MQSSPLLLRPTSMLALLLWGASSVLQGCAEAPSTTPRPIDPAATQPLAQDREVDELFGDSGLLAFEVHRAVRAAPPAEPRDDLSPDDPADLPDQVDCGTLATTMQRQQVDLNQEGTWHALLQASPYIAFRNLAYAANRRHCRANFKDPGDKERDDTAPTPRDGNARLTGDAWHLEYGCEVLSEKLAHAYASLEGCGEMVAVRRLATWQHLLDNARMMQLAACWP